MAPVLSVLYLCLISLASSLLVNALPVPLARDAQHEAEPKIVVAHFMVGNTYNYTVDMWREDMELAYDANIDAFALNLGSEPWQADRIADAYEAARLFSEDECGGEFYLFLSFDMAVTPGTTPAEADHLRSFITKYHDHPSQLKYKGKTLASTFSGGDSTFGSGSADAGWQEHFKGPLEAAGTPVYLIGSFFKSPQEISSFNSLDGYFGWNSGWDLTAQASNTACLADVDACTRQIGSWDPDAVFVDYFKQNGVDKTYMAGISPTFFTHYGPDSFNKNWIYSSDDHLYSTRWETLIEHRDQVDLVEIITWNDYGESSYIGKIKGQQPNSQAWVDGFEHSDLLDVTRYYAQYFKDGVKPEITSDQIFLSGRPHTRDAVASSDGVGKPDNWQFTKDKVWGLFFLTAPATVVLQTTHGTHSQQIECKAGVCKLDVDMAVGEGVVGKIVRNGQTVVSDKPDRTFVNNPATYNFNSWFSSARSS